MIDKTIIEEIEQERVRQLEKFGNQSHKTFFAWCVILGEEFGEICKGVLQMRGLTYIRKEVIQLATVCIAMLEEKL